MEGRIVNVDHVSIYCVWGKGQEICGIYDGDRGINDREGCVEEIGDVARMMG